MVDRKNALGKGTFFWGFRAWLFGFCPADSGRPAAWAGWNSPPTLPLLKHQVFRSKMLRKTLVKHVWDAPE